MISSLGSFSIIAENRIKSLEPLWIHSGIVADRLGLLIASELVGDRMFSV